MPCEGGVGERLKPCCYVGVIAIGVYATTLAEI